MTCYEILDCHSRSEWLDRRRRFVGASESATIFGVGYKDQSAYTVWARKTGRLGDSEDEAEHLRIGQLMEPALREIAAWKIGRGAVHHRENSLWVRRDIPWLAASLDAFLEPGGDAIVPVELKNAGQWTASEWGEGELPLKFAVQVQHQMAVTGAECAYLLGLIGGQKAELRLIERNQAFIDAMIERLAEFWRCVETDTPPEVDGSLATAKALAKLHPQDDGRAIALPEEFAGHVGELSHIKDEIKRLEQRKDTIENQIKAAIGDATYGVAPGGIVFSWKTQDRKGYVVEPTTFRALRTIKALPKGVLVETPLACGPRLAEAEV